MECGPLQASEDAQRNQHKENQIEETRGHFTALARSSGCGSHSSNFASNAIGTTGRPCDQIDSTSVTGQSGPERMQAQRHRLSNRFPTSPRGPTQKEGLQGIDFARAEAWEQKQVNKALEQINQDLMRQPGCMEEVFEALDGKTYSDALDAAVKAEMKRAGNGARYLIGAAKKAQWNKEEG